MSMISTFVHLGIVFVPLGYKHAFSQLTNVDEVHGGKCKSDLFVWVTLIVYVQ